MLTLLLPFFVVFFLYWKYFRRGDVNFPPDLDGRPIKPARRFGIVTVNTLWIILTGERFEHDDAVLANILDTLEGTSRAITSIDSPLKLGLIFFYPNIAKLFPKWSGWEKLKDTVTPRLELFGKTVEDHVKTQDEKNPRDFIDVYLQEIKQTVDENSSFHPRLGKESLKSVMADFFQAGYETTSITMTWILLYLLNHPEVQEKLHEELDRVVGTSRDVSLSDRRSLPYTEAIVLETLRLSSSVPTGVPHSALEDTKFHGYDIPKGTAVFGNLYASHHDVDIWGDPEVFRPERFLQANGSCNQRHEAFVAFGVGRRVCLGETLARDALFLFVGILFQRFKATVEDGAEKPSMETTDNFRRPPEFDVCMEERD